MAWPRHTWVDISIEITAPVDETPGVYENQLINLDKYKRILPHAEGAQSKMIDEAGAEVIVNVSFDAFKHQIVMFTGGIGINGEPVE